MFLSQLLPQFIYPLALCLWLAMLSGLLVTTGVSDKLLLDREDREPQITPVPSSGATLIEWLG